MKTMMKNQPNGTLSSKSHKYTITTRTVWQGIDYHTQRKILIVHCEFFSLNGKSTITFFIYELNIGLFFKPGTHTTILVGH